MCIILADDQPKVRSALRLLLEQQPWTTSVLEAGNTDELLTLAEEHRPRLALLDWELPGTSPERILFSLRALCPSIKVVAMSVNLEAARAALNAGADAFVSKGDPPDALLSILTPLLFNEEPSPK